MLALDCLPTPLSPIQTYRPPSSLSTALITTAGPDWNFDPEGNSEFSFFQVMLGSGLPLAWHSRVREEPSLSMSGSQYRSLYYLDHLTHLTTY